MELILLSLISLFLPTQLGLHFWPLFSFIGGHRSDYLSPTLYFLDLPIIILIFVSLYKHFPQIKISLLNIFLSILILFNTINAIRPEVAIFHYLRFFEIFFLAYSLILNSSKFQTVLARLFSISLILFSSLAWMQFSLQHSLNGLWYLFGERQLNLYTSNVAKISLNSWGLFLRPYSTFSHPNSLAGFLIVSVFILKYFFDKKPSKILIFSLVICLLTIFLTFSRTAIFLVVVLFAFHLFKKNSLYIIPFLLLPLLYFTGNQSSITERFTGVTVALNQIIVHPIWGIGFGNAPLVTPDRQPIHCVPLLLILELGLPLFLCLIFILIKYIVNFRKLPQTLLFAWVCIVATSLVDHYWMTQIQNQLLTATLISLTYPHCLNDKLSGKISSS